MIEVGVTQRLGSFTLDAEFAADSRLIALFGPSGSGKTSLINVIAGLTRPERGRVVIDGAALIDTARGVFLPAHKRRLGMVFQEGRLFPHLSVKQNLSYGAWFAGVKDGGANLARVASLLGIEHLLGRYPNRLSGGEKQRVAIGRALLASPKLLLMDEPLASLDEPRKQEIMPYLERLRDEARIPIVYVSHSVAEVARLSDTLVVLQGGRVRAAGPTLELMQRLDLLPAADGEAGAAIEAAVQSHDDEYGLTTLASRAGRWRVPRLEAAPGKVIRMHIKARDVMIALKRPEEMSALNVIEAAVAEIGPMDGASVEIRLDCSGEALVARLTRYSAERLSLRAGAPVFAIIKSVSFDRASLGAAWRDMRASDAGAAPR
ncbi:MAG: molybdenum ABC transporter ATP-binding protein [Rhodomicrobium sp.]|jgi:molybdate transport system ATP-binding protein